MTLYIGQEARLAFNLLKLLPFNGQEYIKLSGLTDEMGTSLTYLYEIASKMRKAGLIEIKRGCMGGARRRPIRAPVIDVIRALGFDLRYDFSSSQGAFIHNKVLDVLASTLI